MLLPQNVSRTLNVYYSIMAILYNILTNRKEDIFNIDIIFAHMCCGYGKMDEDVSIRQIMNEIRNYSNLCDQPKYY